MKLFISAILLSILPSIGYNQLNSQDSILLSQAQWSEYDCYDQKNTKRIFMNYSNGQESCIIYNLSDKDSIVKYYYSGKIASIGIYYGCMQDTIWSTNSTNILQGNIPIPFVDSQEKLIKEDYFVTIDSVEYIYYTVYQLSYSPIYEMTLYNKDGIIIERKWREKSTNINFKSVRRDKYVKPE